MKKAIIIFVRHPQLGKVKTRLAATLGNEKALDIYQKLLAHTKQIVEKVDADKFIFYADYVPQNDLWNGYQKFQQKQSADLGERMQNALETVFSKGYKSVCLIGSDCYELNADILSSAFLKIEENDFVIGPAADGGYYLLGMKKLQNFVFGDIEWSTNLVLSKTINSIELHHKKYSLLPLLNDIDEAADVPKYWL